MDKEPAVIVSSVTALVTALIGLLVAFGLDISPATRQAIIAVIAPAVAVIFLLGPVVRQMVYSPHSVEQITAKLPDATTPDVAPPPATTETPAG